MHLVCDECGIMLVKKLLKFLVGEVGIFAGLIVGLDCGFGVSIDGFTHGAPSSLLEESIKRVKEFVKNLQKNPK